MTVTVTARRQGVYRDLGRPIGAQLAEQRARLEERYAGWCDDAVTANEALSRVLMHFVFNSCGGAVTAHKTFLKCFKTFCVLFVGRCGDGARATVRTHTRKHTHAPAHAHTRTHPRAHTHTELARHARTRPRT